ncbi:hypothetical protein AMELA_G00187300, partial [Ameiurus melas]
RHSDYEGVVCGEISRLFFFGGETHALKTEQKETNNETHSSNTELDSEHQSWGNNEMKDTAGRDCMCDSEFSFCDKYNMVNKNLPGSDQNPEDHLVNINVGGLKHSFPSSTLQRFPDTRLCRLLSCDTAE